MVLPHPDSPTMPASRPAEVKTHAVDGLHHPERVKSRCESSTRRITSPNLSGHTPLPHHMFLIWVEMVAQPIAHVHGEQPST